MLFRIPVKLSLLLTIITSISLFSQNDLKIISSTRSSLILEYEPTYSDTSIVKIENRSYIKVGFRYGIVSKPEDWGMPEIAERKITVGVPSETGNTIQILSSDYKTLNGNISPKPEMVKDKGMNSFVYKIKSGYNTYTPNTELVRFGEYGLMRDMPVQGIIISPVEYNPQQSNIKLYTKIVFEINFSSNQTLSPKPAGGFLSGAILNYAAAKYWTKGESLRRLKKTLTSSVLSTGTWVRFEAPKEGIYKITKTMLASYGIDPGKVDPRTIRIYNNGGKVLPENINSSRPTDLVENAIMVVGEDDGKFDDGDYILFYGRGNDFWDFDSSSNTIKRYYHPYSKENYYWITSGDGIKGKRIGGESGLSSSLYYNQTSTKSFAELDEDKINIGKSGREYYGDNFSPSTTSRTYLTMLNGRLDNYPIKYNIRFINASKEVVGLEVYENSTPILNTVLYGWGGNEYSNGVAYFYTATYNGPLPDNHSLLKFSFTPTTSSSLGYLDYFEILYQSQLQAVNDNLLFFSKDTTSVIQYNLTGFSSSNIQVFNVSDYANVRLITNTKINGSNCTFQTSERSGGVQKYIAVGSGNYLTPSNPVSMDNSNLHGIQDGAQYVIITNKVFDDAANRLAAYKENQAPEKLSAKVINVGQIYNEFSCGMTDPTAVRDFLKYAYDNWQIKPEYVLLFGKGTYDAKDVEGYNQDFVPAYETQESLDQISSYTTDDYFVRVSGKDSYIDIAYGRIPVTTDVQADSAVDKIIQYETTEDKGLWRNLITLVADDEWADLTNEGNLHTPASEHISTSIIPDYFNQHKIYLGMLPVVLTSSGRRIPQANKDIINAINNGTLILNWIGHGNPSLWAHEQVFVQSTTIPQLHNSDYFFLVAATCDFGYWDKPNFQSGAEELVLLPGAGAIATFSSARLVYSDSNHQLAYQLFSDLLHTPRDSSDLPITIGQAVLATKQILFDPNSQKYEILGDPSIRLLMPRYSAEIDSIDGLNPAKATVQIKALSTVRIYGKIEKPDGSPWNNFNGKGVLSMYDSQREVTVPALSNEQITLQGGVLFNGIVSVSNGKFSTNFVVPKDISYQNKNGKALIYFYNDNADGLGYTTNIIVGGTDTSAKNNGVGPDISIFVDDTTSQVFSLINPNSTLIIKLHDDNGLNTTGTGVGHKMEGILNNDINNPIDFTNYYTGDLNAGGKSGEIKYPFNNLDPGDYTLKVTAWDVFNNSSSKTVNFTVVNSNGLVIKDVYNYPDPFAYKTTFTFQQNLASPINVKIKVYTIAGRMIRQIEEKGINEKFVKVNWDGRDQDGDIIANGTYLYKIIVSSTDGRYNKSVLGKMAIIR